ncbi:MAG: tetratricopeptide repeat protein, partial [Bacteroidota bacterium]
DPRLSPEIDSLLTIAMGRTAPLRSSHPDLYAATLMNAAWQRFRNNEDAAGGEQLMREHLDILLRTHPPEAFELAHGHYILGRYLHESDQYDEAMEAFRAAMPVFVAHYGPDHLRTGGFFSDLAVTCRLAPSCNDAEAFARRALEIRQARLPPNHRNWRTTRHIMGLVLFSNGDYEAAATWFQRALDSAGGDASLSSRYMLSYALLRDGRATEARPHAAEVLRRLATSQTPEKEFIRVGTRRVLAQIRARQGQHEEALDLLDEADALLDQIETRRDWRPDQRIARAVVLTEGGQHDEALALVRKLPDDPALRLDALLVRATGQRANGQDPSATLRDAERTLGDRPARGARARIAALRR